MSRELEVPRPLFCKLFILFTSAGVHHEHSKGYMGEVLVNESGNVYSQSNYIFASLAKHTRNSINK